MATGDVTFDFQNFRTTLPSGLIFIEWSKGWRERDRRVRKMNFLFALLTTRRQLGEKNVVDGLAYDDLLPDVELLALQQGWDASAIPSKFATYKWWTRARAKLHGKEFKWKSRPFVAEFRYNGVSFDLPASVSVDVLNREYRKRAEFRDLPEDVRLLIEKDVQLLRHLLWADATGGIDKLNFKIRTGAFRLVTVVDDPGAN